MKQEFEKMTIKGQKSAILLVRTLLNNPQQFDYIRDTYLKKCHGSWQLKDKLSVMLDTQDSRLTRHQRNYLLKQDKMLSKNDKLEMLKAGITGLVTVAVCVAVGVTSAYIFCKMKGVI